MTQLTQDIRPDIESITEPETPKELGLIPAWSHSTLKTFEACAYRSYIAKVKRIQEDWGPAAKRGSTIHKQAEDYVRDKIAKLPEPLKKFESEFTLLKHQFKECNVELEGEWGFTIEW